MKCEDLLLFCVFNNGKLNIFEFWTIFFRHSSKQADANSSGNIFHHFMTLTDQAIVD